MSGLQMKDETNPENRLANVKQILELGKKSMSELRKMNRNLEKAWNGPNMTKAQLIYQIVYYQDAPDHP